jgi:hypothetical protein
MSVTLTLCALYSLLLVWAPDEKVRHGILVENPAVLYDYPKSA